MTRVCFLRPPGPGAVVRFLERRAAPGDEAADALLSDALVGGWRALICRHDLFDPWPELLRRAFPPEVAVLAWDDASWTAAVWDEAGRRDAAAGPVAASEPWWRRLPGRPAAPAGHVAWAKARGLPLDRALDPRVRTLDFATVDALDQRGLLHEDAPRLYRIRIPRAAGV